jgi:hypothetical protein
MHLLQWKMEHVAPPETIGGQNFSGVKLWFALFVCGAIAGLIVTK